MQYIVHKRFKGKTVSGEVNIPAMSICEERNGWIYYNNRPICTATSACSHKHFAANNDGNGMRRGNLTTKIQRVLADTSDKSTYNDRWNRIWNDNICSKYKRKEHTDHWLWNHHFFEACLEDLIYIAELIGIKE